MKLRSKSRVFKTDFDRDAGAAGLPRFCLLLFDMRLLVFWSTAVSGPQMIKASEPRSIIYAVILHEVCFALDWVQQYDWGALSRSPHFRDHLLCVSDC